MDTSTAGYLKRCQYRNTSSLTRDLDDANVKQPVRLWALKVMRKQKSPLLKFSRLQVLDMR